MGNTIFSKIISREIPADIVFENENVIAFRDIKPQAPVHILVIPKLEIPSINDVKTPEHNHLLGQLFDAANEIAKAENIAENGFRIVINSGKDSGQEVLHLHLHLLGGRKMTWPPG
ncbi:MAG: histidine triad nucleotide-binding protein [bacterium]